MKTKQFVVIAILAAALLAVGILVNRSRSHSMGGAMAGGKLVPDLSIEKVKSLAIQGPEATVTVEFREDAWRVAERDGYPAKYDTVITVLEDLRDLAVVQNVAAGEAQYAQLKLNEPGKDDAGTLVTVTYEDGTQVASLVFGKDHKNGGRFLRAKDGKDVIVVAKSFYQLGQKPGSWLDDEFFKIGDIQEATLSEAGKELWKATRKDKTADMELLGELPEGKEVDTYKLGRVKSAFSYARFADVKRADAAKPEETGMDTPKTFVARQFDGMVYTVRIGKKDKEDRFHLAVQAAYEGPTERTPAADEKPEDKEKKDKEFADQLAEFQKTVAAVNARTRDWIYLVDNWTVEGVTKSRDEMLKDKPKPKEDTQEKDEDKGTETN